MGAALRRIRETWGQPMVRRRKLDVMAAVESSRREAMGGEALDDRTWADLNLDEVFGEIDRAQSTLGQHAIYHRLRTSPVGDHLDAFEALVERMATDANARERAQLALARLQDPQGYDIWWVARAALERPGWYAIFPILGVVVIALIVAAVFQHQLVSALVAAVVLNILVRFATDSQVGHIGRAFRQFAPLIATAQGLAFLRGDEIDPIVAPLHDSLMPLARLKLISRWVNGDPLMLSGSLSPGAALVTDFLSSIYEYFNLALLLDAAGAYFGLKDLAAHGPALLAAVAAAGDVDAAIAVASYRASSPSWARPRFVEPRQPATLDAVVHPLIGEPVPNSIAVPSGHGVLVTGSNMSGKSTFLRTVGVNAVLGQTIHTCFAEGYAAPIVRVRSCIGRADDLLSGKSYYLAEVDALLDLVRASETGAPHLFLLDELFRGTNAVERIAAGQAVLLELLLDAGGGVKPHVALAATHDAELVDLLSGTFEPYHFGDAVGPDGLIFDHQLKPGPATTRNAIALLRINGAPASLLARATASADRLDRERGSTLTPR